MKALLSECISLPRRNIMLFRIPVKSIILCGIAFSTGWAQNDINAVTSASGQLKLKSGKAYATEAIIVWSDHRNNGEVQTLEWGTSTSYGASMNLKPLTKDTDIKDTLKPLTPSTKYYAKFHRTYTQENADITTAFDFTTPAATAAVPFVEGNQFVGTSPTAHISLFSTSGRKIVELPLSKRIVSAQELRGVVTPGLYIAVASDRERQPLKSFRVMVEK